MVWLKVGRARKWTPRPRRQQGGANKPSARRSLWPAQTSEGPRPGSAHAARTQRTLSPRPLRSQRSASCWLGSRGRWYPLGRTERRMCVGPAKGLTLHFQGMEAARTRESIALFLFCVRNFCVSSNVLPCHFTQKLTRRCHTQYSWAGTKMQVIEIVMEL